MTIFRSIHRWASVHRSMLALGIAAGLVLAVAAVALAAPKGPFAVFAQCPLKNTEVNICLYATSTGGEFNIGSAKVSIDRTVTFQGGSIYNEKTEAEKFVEAANGETLSKTPLAVPGGLSDILSPESFPKSLQEAFEKDIQEGRDGVTATLELVATPVISRANFLAEEGAALTWQVRIHLSNPFLGSACYIGSKASPITLPLTTGATSPPPPNESIKGTVGDIEIGTGEASGLVTITGNKLVENAFSEPTASGCGGIYSFIIDPAINAKLGLPSAAGRNTFIFEDTFKEATAEAVKNSEK